MVPSGPKIIFEAGHLFMSRKWFVVTLVEHRSLCQTWFGISCFLPWGLEVSGAEREKSVILHFIDDEIEQMTEQLENQHIEYFDDLSDSIRKTR